MFSKGEGVIVGVTCLKSVGTQSISKESNQNDEENMNKRNSKNVANHAWRMYFIAPFCQNNLEIW